MSNIFTARLQRFENLMLWQRLNFFLQFLSFYFFKTSFFLNFYVFSEAIEKFIFYFTLSLKLKNARILSSRLQVL